MKIKPEGVRIFLAATLSFAFMFSVTMTVHEACAADSKKTEFAEAKYTFAHHLVAGQAGDVYARDFAKLVNEMTNGKVTIEVFDSNQLGNQRENTEALRFGTLDFSVTDLPTLGTIIPKMSVVSLPYLFDSLAHAEKFYKSEESAKLDQEVFDTVGIKFLGHSHVGYRVVVGHKALNTPDDLKNLKIATPNKPINVDTMKAFGANPTVVPYGETYTALQTSIVDACDLTLDSVYLARLHEVAKTISLTHHIYVDLCLAVSKQTFQSMSPKLQNVIIKASEIATERNHLLLANVYEDAKQNLLKDSAQLISPDPELFRQTAQSVWEQFFKTAPEGRALVDYIRNLK